MRRPALSPHAADPQNQSTQPLAHLLPTRRSTATFLALAALPAAIASRTMPTCPAGQIAAIVDWENLDAGTILDQDLSSKICFGQGITILDPVEAANYDSTFCISVTGVANGKAEDHRVMIFDAANPTGGDTDLTQPAQSKVLIFSEDNDKNDPDDYAGGGRFFLDFAAFPTFTSAFPSVNLREIVLLDLENGLSQGIFINKLPLGGFEVVEPYSGVPDGGIEYLPLNKDGVTDMEIELVGSGAIGDVFVCLEKPCPLCETGKRDASGLICCDAQCDRCGGCDCADQVIPGGNAAERCCPGAIWQSQLYCVDSTDVACIACCPGESCEYPRPIGGSCL